MPTDAPSAPAKVGPKTITVPGHWEHDENGKPVYVEQREMVPPPGKAPVKRTERDVWVPGDWKAKEDGSWDFVAGHWATPAPVAPAPAFTPRLVRAKETGFYPDEMGQHRLVMGPFFDAGGKRISGESFMLLSAESFSPSWMEEVDAEEKRAVPADVPMTTAQQRAGQSPQQRADGTFTQHTKSF